MCQAALYDSHSRYSVVEESQVGVHQGDALLITGIDHHLVSCGPSRGSNVLHTTLQRQTPQNNQSMWATNRKDLGRH
jgi:hypothetical protein